MSFIEANPEQNQAVIDRINAKILLIQNFDKFNKAPVENYTQNVYIAYFAITCSSFGSWAVWNHSPRLQEFLGHHSSRFILPIMALSLFGAFKVNDRFSRRRRQALNRYDRDWRNMPTFIQKE